jgi:hypothetical protein
MSAINSAGLTLPDSIQMFVAAGEGGDAVPRAA